MIEGGREERIRILWRDGEGHSTSFERSGIRIGREGGERERRGELGKQFPLSSVAVTFSSFL